MGLFKRTKKKDENIAVTEAVQENTTAKAQEEVVETEEEKAAKAQAAKEQEELMRQANPMLSTVANEGRRFTLLVEDAKQLGIQQGIEFFVLEYLEDGFSAEQITKKLVRRFSMTEEQAKETVERYRK